MQCRSNISLRAGLGFVLSVLLTLGTIGTASAVFDVEVLNCADREAAFCTYKGNDDTCAVAHSRDEVGSGNSGNIECPVEALEFYRS